MQTTYTARVSKAVAARVGLKKFNLSTSSDPFTVTQPEELQMLSLLPAYVIEDRKRKQEEVDGGEERATMGYVCRICGGSHMTRMCPNYSSADTSALGGSGEGVSAAAASGAYVPPSRRDGSGGATHVDPCLRIDNLDDSITDMDLRDLFNSEAEVVSSNTFTSDRNRSGVTRINVVRDRETGVSRGFAYANFTSMDAARRVMEKWHGYRKNNLVLSVKIHEDKRPRR